MAADPKMLDRARDELFSHINRCGVLQAAEDDQKTWMDETIDYLGERYPDLNETDLQNLYSVGTRFCKPAIRNGSRDADEGRDVASDPPVQVASPNEVATEVAPEAATEVAASAVSE